MPCQWIDVDSARLLTSVISTGSPRRSTRAAPARTTGRRRCGVVLGDAKPAGGGRRRASRRIAWSADCAASRSPAPARTPARRRAGHRDAEHHAGHAERRVDRGCDRARRAACGSVRVPRRRAGRRRGRHVRRRSPDGVAPAAARRDVLHDVAVEQPVALALRHPCPSSACHSGARLRDDAAALAAGDGLVAHAVADALHRK